MKGPQQYRIRIRKNLDDHFSDEEFRTFCFDLGVDYDDLPAQGQAAKARELVAKLERDGRLPQLITHCKRERPNVNWLPRIYISYKRHDDRDQKLARFLYQRLNMEGYELFFDQNTDTNSGSLEEKDQHIKKSDFLIVLLSKKSANSEMVLAEVTRAHNHAEEQGYPSIFPVRISYKKLLPYTIANAFNSLQYTTWQSEADNERVIQEIQDAIWGHLPDKQPIQPTPARDKITVSEDGTEISGASLESPYYEPLPEFDARILDDLVTPGGTVQMRDMFYIERDADVQIRRQVTRPGNITTIRASRQTGKSSLLIRGIHYAHQQGATTIHLDMQRVDRGYLKTTDIFYRYLANFIAGNLRLSLDTVQSSWQSALGDHDKLTNFMIEHVLAHAESPIVLAIDEVDRLLETGFHEGFFGLLRSWNSNAAYNDLWERLNVVMVISTEPYLLIPNVNQSPFNVGPILYLVDFTEKEVQELNRRHGSPVRARDFSEFMTLLGGHPYLTRQALYTLVNKKLRWSEFMEIAPLDTGPFGDHLRRQLWLLSNEETLRKALKQIIRHNYCNDEIAGYRLLKAGLIKGTGDLYICRCDLYRKFFEDSL